MSTKTVSETGLHSLPANLAVDVYKDYYGNEVGSFMFADAHSELKIDSKIEVVTKSRPLPEDTVAKEEQWAAFTGHQIPGAVH